MEIIVNTLQNYMYESVMLANSNIFGVLCSKMNNLHSEFVSLNHIAFTESADCQLLRGVQLLKLLSSYRSWMIGCD